MQFVAGGFKNVGRFVNFVRNNPESQNNSTKYSGLSIHKAAFNGNLPALEELLKHSEIDQVDEDGWTPLHYASWQGYPQLVELLVKKGAKIDIQDQEKRTALHLATYKGRTDVVMILIAAKADLEAKDKNLLTPLHRAVIQGFDDLVQLFLKCGSRVDTLTPEGLTVMHLAAWKGYQDIISSLEKNGVSTNVLSGYGSTPLHEASVAGRVESINALLSHNADINIRDMANYLPEDHAFGLGYYDIYKILKDHRKTHNIKYPLSIEQATPQAQGEVLSQPEPSAPSAPSAPTYPESQGNTIQDNEITKQAQKQIQKEQPSDKSSKENDKRYLIEVQKLKVKLYNERQKQIEEEEKRLKEDQKPQAQPQKVFKIQASSPIQPSTPTFSQEMDQQNLGQKKVGQDIDTKSGKESEYGNYLPDAGQSSTDDIALLRQKIERQEQANKENQVQSQLDQASQAPLRHNIYKQENLPNKDQDQQYQKVNTDVYKSQFQEEPQQAMSSKPPSKSIQTPKAQEYKDDNDLKGDDYFDDDDYFEREPEDPDYGWSTSHDNEWGDKDPYQLKLEQVEKQRREKKAQEEKNQEILSFEEAERKLAILDMEISKQNGWLRGMDIQDRLMTLRWMQQKDENKDIKDDKIKAFRGTQPSSVSQDMANTFIKDQTNSTQNIIKRVLNSMQCPQFQYEDLQQATQNFSQAAFQRNNFLGKVFKGILQNISVQVISISRDTKYTKDIQKFVKDLDERQQLRHPHLAKLIGICQDPLILVYENCTNLTLQEYLYQSTGNSIQDMNINQQRDSSYPKNKNYVKIGWQQRLKIAMEITSALTYLENSQPRFFYNELQAFNVQLDENYITKLDGCQISLSDPNEQYKSQNCIFNNLGEIFLQLLSGRSNIALIKEEAKKAYTEGVIMEFTDAGCQWPIQMALSFTALALRCVEKDQQKQQLSYSNILQQLKTYYDKSFQQQAQILKSQASKELQLSMLPNLLCPITRAIMFEPVVAADGFTYEKEAIQQLITQGYNRSPMTNQQFEHPYFNLNKNLRDTIITWLDKQEGFQK